MSSPQSAPAHQGGATAPGQRQAHPDRSTVMSDMSHAIRIKPEQAIAEAKALGEKIAKGSKLFEEIRDEDVAIATTPKDEVWRQDKVTLYRYRVVCEELERCCLARV
jgi:hypothetical protein